MSKNQLIEAIREQNRTATAEFLAVFDEDALSNYLNHVTRAGRPARTVAPAAA